MQLNRLLYMPHAYNGPGMLALIVGTLYSCAFMKVYTFYGYKKSLRNSFCWLPIPEIKYLQPWYLDSYKRMISCNNQLAYISYETQCHHGSDLSVCNSVHMYLKLKFSKSIYYTQLDMTMITHPLEQNYMHALFNKHGSI